MTETAMTYSIAPTAPYALDADNRFIDELDSYDDHAQVMMELAEMGDNSRWARGDVMIHMIPPEELVRGRPRSGDTRKLLVDLARSGRLSQGDAVNVYKTSEYFERKSIDRSILVEAGVDWSFADLARRKVPGGATQAVKELVHAKDNNMSRATFKRYLAEKYPQTAGPNESNSLQVDPSMFQLLEGDMLEVLEDFDAATVDLVVADPPYNVTDWDWDKRGTPEEFLSETRHWLTAVQRVLKPAYHFFWFCSPRFSADIEMILRELRFPIKSRIVWHRRNMSMGSDAQDRFIDSWEMVFHCGTKPLAWAAPDQPQEWTDARFDVQTFAVPQTNFMDQKVHPTQKPLALVKRLVEFGSEPGAVVLDPFAGSGTTGHACALLDKRFCVLIEKEHEYISVIQSRLRGL